MRDLKITVITPQKVTETNTDGTKTLRDVLEIAGHPVDSPCGGKGRCRKCAVRVTGVLRFADGTMESLSDENVLACCAYPAGDIVVHTDTVPAHRIEKGSADIPAGGIGLGIAVDIGTTTVAVYLCDLETGKTVSSVGELNRQRAWGSDVISRIEKASTSKGLAELSAAVRGQIWDMVKRLTSDTDRITYISVTGNTVMEHIFAGISPESIGTAPFEPKSRFGYEIPAAEIFPETAKGCTVFMAPAPAGFVGGDVVSGLCSSGAADSEDIVLYIDIGTNGEMALGNRDGFISCAAAAGPAFEGAELCCGSGAVAGAIERVYPDMSFDVVGGGDAISICGSGAVDAAAALLKNGYMDDTGKLIGGRYSFSQKAYVTEADMRSIQLAKAAIRAGIDTLADIAGVEYHDISRVMIAGGFGSAINIASAAAIGLLPPQLAGKTVHVGNCAGKGAIKALNPEYREKVLDTAGKCRYTELSMTPDFGPRYVAAMAFDEWKILYE